MTRAQFAYAVGTDEKWVENAANFLHLRLVYTVEFARRMGLLRLFARDLGLPIRRAMAMVDRAAAQPFDTQHYCAAESEDESGAVIVDLARYHSAFIAALATAFHQLSPRAAGRRERSAPDPLHAATRYGVDLSLLRAHLQQAPTQRLRALDANVKFLGVGRVATGARHAIRVRPNGAEMLRPPDENESRPEHASAWPRAPQQGPIR